MSEYLVINILTVAIPALLSYDKKIQFYKKLHAVFGSIIIVGIVFIIWDAIAASRNDWSFNPEYLLGIYFYKLPLEELFFFVSVPYSCLFLYETGLYYLGDKRVKFSKYIALIAAGIIIIAGIIFLDQYYTFTVLLFSAIFLIVAVIFHKELLASKLYWMFISFTYIPFFIVNYFLTSLPIVEYNPLAIWGIRIISIPIEDFFYSFSLLSFYLMVYLMLKRKWIREKT
ncbi:MAG: lycopene cyclase domain-containing protein [bacterium]